MQSDKFVCAAFDFQNDRKAVQCCIKNSLTVVMFSYKPITHVQSAVSVNVAFLFFEIARTNLNYRVLGINTAAIFLLNDHSLYAPIYLR